MNNIHQQDGFAREASREFFRSVYGYMFAALGVSGLIAYMCGTREFFETYFVSNGAISPLFWVVALAPVGLGFVIQLAYERLSIGLLMGLYVGYSALMGLSLSTIFLVYDMPAIVSTFFVSAGAFAGMAILGYTTKVDLSRFGSMLYMVFIGIFIAGIVNIFMKSEMMEFIISIIGVFVFTGLTAYQMQQLKEVSNNPNLSVADRNKLALIGGLQLYILFINLFLTLLRLLGSRN